MPRRHRRRTLRELADVEEQMLDVVWTQTGDAAARDVALQREGVYRRYAKLFHVYLRRGGDGVEGREATRRAVFLFWCSATQPSCLTGVDELSEVDRNELLADLDNLCADGALDAQLHWMLAYYHAQYGSVFAQWPQCRDLQRVLAATSGGEWRAVEPTVRDFEHRGLMGHFWTQVVRAG